MIGGDALDRYVTVPLESRTNKKVLRALARSILNPPQSFANLMMLEKPWRRENRGSNGDLGRQMYLKESDSLYRAVSGTRDSARFEVPKFEISGAVPSFYRTGKLTCIGGDGVASFRVGESWQWTAEVGGCTLGNSLPKNWSGDSLTFTTGPQWILNPKGRWTPHAHFRVGGQKVTEEHEDPVKKQKILSQVTELTDYYRGLYTQHWESTGFSASVGGGLDVGLNRGLAVRVANLEYVRSWLGQLNGTDFDHGVRFNIGLVLRVGTW